MFRLDSLRKVSLFLFQNEGAPVVVDLCVDVDAADEGLDGSFLLRSSRLEEMARSIAPRMDVSVQLVSWHLATSMRM